MIKVKQGKYILDVKKSMNEGITIGTCSATKLIVFLSSKELFGPLFIKKGNRNIYSMTWKTSKW